MGKNGMQQNTANNSPRWITCLEWQYFIAWDRSEMKRAAVRSEKQPLAVSFL